MASCKGLALQENLEYTAGRVYNQARKKITTGWFKERLMENCKIDFSSLAWQNSSKGLLYKTYNDGKRQISILEYSHDFVDKEWCQRGHYGYVIEGQGELIFSGIKVQVSAGDGIFLPAGPENKHQFKALSDKVTLFLVGDMQ